MNCPDWNAHTYPLLQVTVRLQGARHSSRADVINQLETVLDRLRSGDDCGYEFELRGASMGPSYFDEPAGEGSSSHSILSATEVAVVVETTLVEKTQRLERFVADLQRELKSARAVTPASMLGWLRMRETVLLYIGNGQAGQLAEQLAQEFSFDITNQVLSHLFNLNNAPLPVPERDAIRAAFNYGMTRW